MTKEQIFMHYLDIAKKAIPGKSKAARESQLLAAYDIACADIEKLLDEREERREKP